MVSDHTHKLLFTSLGVWKQPENASPINCRPTFVALPVVGLH